MKLALALALVMLASVVAHADDLPATPAEVRGDPASAFEAAVNRHYDAMSDGRPCSACDQKIVRQRTIRGGFTVQLRKAATLYGDVYAVVFGRDDRWGAADAIDDIQVGECGMGKCVSEDIRAITIVREKDAVWVSLHVNVRVDHFDPKSRWDHSRDVVIGCTLGRDPSCATVSAGRAFTKGAAKRSGTKIHVVEDDETRDVTVVF